jgi:hypothetical protein
MRIVLALLVGLALIGLADRLRGPAPSEASPPERADLNPWALLGCYELRVEPWESDSSTASRPPLLSAPARIRLAADSVDEWGRVLDTYRAVPLGEQHDERLRDVLRWFVRADTLWLVWSGRPVRAGVALLASSNGAGLFGRAAYSDGASNEEGTAEATAWRVNCATLERETEPRRPWR